MHISVPPRQTWLSHSPSQSIKLLGNHLITFTAFQDRTVQSP